MNTEAIRYPTRQNAGILAGIVRRIRALIARQRQYGATKPDHASVRQGDLLRSLPLDEKLRLGMYRYMD